MLSDPILLQIAAVILSSSLAGFVWYFVTQRSGQGPEIQSILPPENAVRTSRLLTFEFDGKGQFLHSNEAGHDLLASLHLEGAEWPQFRAAMLGRFPALPARVTACEKPSYRVFDAASPVDNMQIGLEAHELGVSVQMAPALDNDICNSGEVHKILSNLSDLDALRAASENAPYPIWVTQTGGNISWCNAAYERLDAQISRNASAPDAPLFTLPETKQTDRPERISIRDTDRNRTYWFDVLTRSTGQDQMHFAFDVHAVVNAEAAQRNFVQTLAKTFAQLSTGLAIFDRNRQLVLFNPALIDLTQLPPDFLSGRPNLFSVFDMLRNNQIMPEPKSYANWRERIADVVTAASDGNFLETWNLPTGQTYKITGRPHPDGAVAFLFEDISAEISLKRQFREEMLVTQSALNALNEGIVVFSPQGTLIQINEPMMQDWGLPAPGPDMTLTVTDATRIWQKSCRPNPLWGEIRDFFSDQSNRTSWSGSVSRKDGQTAEVAVSPIAGGAILVSIKLQEGPQSALSPDTKEKSAAVA